MRLRGWGRQRRGGRRLPWALLVVVVILYAIAGLILSAFAAPFWVWPLALVGTLLQALALAGPRSLTGLRPEQVRGAVWLACWGAGGLVVALAVAGNYAGTDQLGQVSLESLALTIGLVNLGVILLTAIATVVGTRAGDRLVDVFSRWRSAWVLAGICFLGLFIGGIVGVLLISEARLI